MNDNPLIQALLGNRQAGGINFGNLASNFELDNQRRVKVDPITGEKIKGKDRRKLKNLIANPSQILPGMAINMNIPTTPGGMGNQAALASLVNLAASNLGSLSNNKKGQ